MVLKVLGNWQYVPKFAGNTKMRVVFKRLSAKDELGIIEASGEDSRIGIFEASIVEIKDPIMLDHGDGPVAMTVSDIGEIGELRPLFYELLREYSKKTAVNEENLKKS